MGRKYIAPVILAAATVIPLAGLFLAIHCRWWDAATVFATLIAGLVAADVVVWQGYLIKRQLAFSTYLDLDKEWNSEEMIALRQKVHAPGAEEWDHSRLEGILEFFEKLALMFRISGNLAFIYQSTLGWYASRFFLYAREHGQIQFLRDLWEDDVYTDLEYFYDFYLRNEVGNSKVNQRAWELKYLAKEEKFWAQERED